MTRNGLMTDRELSHHHPGNSSSNSNRRNDMDADTTTNVPYHGDLGDQSHPSPPSQRFLLPESVRDQRRSAVNGVGNRGFPKPEYDTESSSDGTVLDDGGDDPNDFIYGWTYGSGPHNGENARGEPNDYLYGSLPPRSFSHLIKGNVSGSVPARGVSHLTRDDTTQHTAHTEPSSFALANPFYCFNFNPYQARDGENEPLSYPLAIPFYSSNSNQHRRRHAQNTLFDAREEVHEPFSPNDFGRETRPSALGSVLAERDLNGEMIQMHAERIDRSIHTQDDYGARRQPLENLPPGSAHAFNSTSRVQHPQFTHTQVPYAPRPGYPQLRNIALFGHPYPLSSRIAGSSRTFTATPSGEVHNRDSNLTAARPAQMANSNRTAPGFVLSPHAQRAPRSSRPHDGDDLNHSSHGSDYMSSDEEGSVRIRVPPIEFEQGFEARVGAVPIEFERGFGMAGGVTPVDFGRGRGGVTSIELERGSGVTGRRVWVTDERGVARPQGRGRGRNAGFGGV